MLNKFFIFYAGLMLTLVLTVMFLLISAEVAHLSITKNELLEKIEASPCKDYMKAQANAAHAEPDPNGRENVNEVHDAANEDVKLLVSTDKEVYGKSEKVLIRFSSNSDKGMMLSGASDIEVKTRKDMGKNGEIAYIERKINGEWIVVEPVKRCSLDCDKPCNEKNDFKINAAEDYAWNQEIFSCRNGKMEKSLAESGEYRISTAAWNEESKKNEQVYSNVFEISALSKK